MMEETGALSFLFPETVGNEFIHELATSKDKRQKVIMRFETMFVLEGRHTFRKWF